MTSEPTSSDTRSRQIDVAIAEYLEAIEQGAPPEQEVFLTKHPEIADELREFLADYHRFKDRAPRAPTETSDHVTSAAPGTTIGQRYRLLEVIGEGGMG